MTYATWDKMAGVYSGCNLTLVRDRLVAISGLARLFEARLGDEYISRLWRRKLESQLLWTAANPCQRITPCLAPSWPWASLDDRCCLEWRGYFEHMIDASVTVQQVGIMGNSSADPPEYYIGLLDPPGRLRILCEYLFQTTMSPKKVSCRAYSAQVDGCGITFYVYAIFDCQSAFDTDQTSQIKLFFVPVQVFKDYNLSDTEEDIMEPGEPTDRGIDDRGNW